MIDARDSNIARPWPMSRRIFWGGIAACYGLAYVLLLLLAARKDFNVTDTYSLLVWLVSAFALWSFCGVLSFGIGAVMGRFKIRRKIILLLWMLFTILIGSGLIFNAR